MHIVQIVFGLLIIAASIFLVYAVLQQSGKAKNLSGAIAGGADTYLGKTKGNTKEKMYAKWTTIVSVIFVVLVLVSYLIQ